MRSPFVFAFVTILVPASGDITPQTRTLAVCGNTANGIVVGKPRLFDERTLALLIESLEARRTELAARSHSAAPGVSDSLAEQTLLDWQIENLATLSDRALSDRVLLPAPTGGGGEAVRRPQAVLGFQISIDPAEKYSRALADVEVTILSKAEYPQAPALISLIPRDKTYNIAAVSHDPQPAGALAAQTLIAGSGGPPLFLLKDADTVSLERFNPTPENIRGCSTGYRESSHDLTFAWQFRPVLGRESVDPGARQVYAFLALPASATEDFDAAIHVHTHWRYLKKPKSGRFSSKVVSDLVDDSSRDELWPDAIHYNPAEMERSLRPRVTGLRFVYGGGEDVQVAAEGENFLSDTRVTAGAATFSPVIERERRLRFSAPVRALLDYDAFVAARFASSVPLIDPLSGAQDSSSPAWGLKIESAKARPKDHRQSEVRIKLKSRQHKFPLAEFIVNKTLAAAAGRIYLVASVDTDPTDADALLFRFDAPTETLRGAPRIQVARLFAGDLYRDSAEITLEDDIAATKVDLLASSADEVLLGISGSGFSSLAVVQIAGVSYSRWTIPAIEVSGNAMIELRLKRTALEGARQLSVSQGYAQPILLPLPDLGDNPAVAHKPRRRR